MNVNMELKASDLSMEDLHAFVRAIREWELLTSRTKVAGICLETDPVMSVDEGRALFEGIYDYEDATILTKKPKPKAVKLLALGRRGIVVDAQLVGYCDELTLSIGESSPEELKKLQDTQIIALIKIGSE